MLIKPIADPKLGEVLNVLDESYRITLVLTERTLS